MKERRILPEMLPKLKAQGVLGIASDLIKYDKSNAPVFSSLLGSTVIVDTIENAVSLAKSTRYSFKIVTLDGDVINPQGSITGGSKKDTAVNLLGRERELEDTKKAVEVIKVDIEKLNARIETLKKEKEVTNAALLEISGDIHELEVAIVRLNDEIEGLENAADDLEDEDRNLGFQFDNILDRIEIIDATLAETKNSEKEINDQKSSASESKRIMTSRFEQLKKQREELYES